MSDEYDEDDVEVRTRTRRGVRTRQSPFQIFLVRTARTVGISAAAIIVFTAILGYPVTMWPSMLRAEQAETESSVQPKQQQPQPVVEAPKAENPPPAQADHKGADVGFGMFNTKSMGTEQIVAQELAAKIIEVPSILGNVTLPEAESEVGKHHANMVDAYFRLNGEDKIRVFEDEAAWLVGAATLDTDQPYADAAIQDLVVAFDQTARNGLTAQGIPWIASSIRGIRAFGDYPVEWNGTQLPAVEVARILESDALAALQQEAAEAARIAAEKAEAARIAAEEAEAARQAALQNPPAANELPASNELPSGEAAPAPVENPVPQPEDLLNLNPQPAGKIAFNPEEVPVTDITGEITTPMSDVPAAVLNAPSKALGIGWSAAPIMWTLREVWNVVTNKVEWAELPGTMNWVVLEEFVVYKGTVAGIPLEIHSVFIGETADTLSDEIARHGLPALYALRSNQLFGEDEQGRRWANITSVIHMPRPAQEGEVVRWNEFSGMLADFMR